MKNIIQISLLLLLGPQLSYGGILQLALECYPIPNHVDQLCVLATQSPHGPWDQVVYYRSNPDQQPVLLGIDKGGVATFGGIEFSTEGRYFMLNWAEEGHPLFHFYKTQEFLNGNTQTSVGFYEQYHFDHIDYFGDDGIVVIGLTDKTGKCIDTRHYSSINDKDHCHHFLRLD